MNDAKSFHIPPNRHTEAQQLFWQAGFNLFEVMIALLILSFGLLGLAALQNFSLKATHQSFQRTQATLSIQDIVDRMRTNPVGVAGGSYDINVYTGAVPTPPQDCSSSPCTNSADLASYDLSRWVAYITDPKNIGPTGEVQILPDNGTPGMFRVGIRWTEADLIMTQTQTVQLF